MQPDANRIRDLPLWRDANDEADRFVMESYQHQLLKTLQEAIQTGYNGVGIVHLTQTSRAGLRLAVWQTTKWETEPPAESTDGCRRFDFRYYDRGALLDSLSRGKWPGP